MGKNGIEWSFGLAPKAPSSVIVDFFLIINDQNGGVSQVALQQIVCKAQTSTASPGYDEIKLFQTNLLMQILQ